MFVDADAVEGGLAAAGLTEEVVSIPGTASATVWVFSCRGRRDQQTTAG